MLKSLRLLAIFAASVAALAPSAQAQLSIPSDGSDGALIVTSNTVIDLSQAVTAAWDANNSANAGKGIYDSNKWAVVFKYSSVVVSNGATLTFANHPSRAPVVWLVSGDVTIGNNCTVNLDGQAVGYNAPYLGEPGSGGFRGGAGNYSAGVGSSSRFGPGGGYTGDWGSGGSYGTAGSGSQYPASTTYGNPSLLPPIGGSGGGGFRNDARGGGPSGGAILIASAATVTISGTVRANGGSANSGGGNGSGGGIRLVASTLGGSGTIQCLAGSGGGAPGGLGRIRIERVTNNANLQVNPDPSIVPLQGGATPLIWLPTDGPTASIVSIGGVSAPADPRASFGTYGPDVSVPQTANTVVVIATTHAESASTVKVRVMPRANGNYTETTAILTATNSTSPLVLLRTATNVPVSPGYSAVQVEVVRL
jgi:hypothetical protein